MKEIERRGEKKSGSLALLSKNNTFHFLKIDKLEEFISFDMFKNINRNLELGYNEMEIHDGFEIIGAGSSRFLTEKEKKFLEKLVENIF